MATMDPQLARRAQENPESTFRVILRVQGDIDARREQVETYGFTVTRQLRLVHGYAAVATGSTLLCAAAEDWILSIELDAPVRTMTGNS